MISFNYKSVGSLLAILALVFAFSGCKKDLDGLAPATFPAIGDVFIDGFSAGLQYDSYDPAEGAFVGAFEVVSDVTYEGDAAMRFAIPNPDNPDGSFAGGTFTVESGRDLSGFNALTFWMKASKNATVDLLGFGDEFEFGESEYLTSLSNVTVNSNWQQYIIPIPDASFLTRESGMFWYSEGTGNDDDLGYTLWIDEVKFEKLETLAQYRPAIQNGQDDDVDGETGQNITITGLTQTVSTDRGDVTVNASPYYYTFSSSNTSIATVSNAGVAMVLDAGTTEITAKLGENDAAGSLTITGTGAPILPTPSPAQTRDADSVIALWSNDYDERPVDTWNARYQFSTAEEEFIEVDGDDMIRYRNLNFVGIEFKNPTIDVSEMTHFHINIWTPDETTGAEFKVLLADAGPDGTLGTTDDVNDELTFTSPLLQTEEWVTIEVPLSQFAGLTSRNRLVQMVLSGTLPNVFVDNVYFYIDGGPTGPEPELPFDFEDGVNAWLPFDNGATSAVINNPDMNGNMSAKVLEFNRVVGAAWYSGFVFDETLRTSPLIDLANGTEFSMKMWSPNAGVDVRFRLEGGVGVPDYEIIKPIGSANQWVTMSFDFSDQATAGQYTKIAVFPDWDPGDQNPETVQSIYYFDDIEQDFPMMSEPELPFDFEDEELVFLPFDNGATAANIANPDMMGNMSARVLEFNRVVGAAWYSGFIFDETLRTSPLVDLSNGTLFKMKFWSPNDGIDVRFRLEGGVGVPDVEVIKPVSGASQWVTMEFDFTSLVGAADQYTKIAIFPDWDEGNQVPEPTGAIYYFDDIEQDFPVIVQEPSLPFDFEDEELVFLPFDNGATAANIANPDMTGNMSARVLEFNRVVGAAWYSGFIFDDALRTSPLVDLSNGKVFKMKFWSPNDGIDVRFRLEGGVGVPDVEVINPVSGASQWVTMEFDFTSQVGDADQYTKIAIFPDWDPGDQNPETVQSIYYFDDIELTTGSTGADCDPPMDPSTTTLPVDFENCEDLTGVFESGDGVTGYPTANPDMTGINTSGKVYQYNKVDGAAWYSGLWQVFPSNYDMTTTKVFKMKVWSSKANALIRFQIEKEGMQGPIVTYQVDQTVVNANTWTELTFDFSVWPFTTGTNVYDRITIFPDFVDDGPSDGNIFYIDDIILTN